MNRLIILFFLGILVLSGCVDKFENKNNLRSNVIDNPTDNRSDIRFDVANSGIDIQTKIDKNVDIDDNNTGSEWCEPGSKINVDLLNGQIEYTIVGITDYTDDNGKTYSGLCKAERVIKGGNSIKYFNREETIEIMKSESYSTNGSAHAESSVSVSVTGNR